MPLFFVISGYLFSLAYFKDGELQRKRLISQVLNFILLYVVYEILFIFFKSFVGNYVVNEVSLKDILFIWKTPVGPYWYLYDLLFLYLFFAVMGKWELKWEIGIFAAIFILSQFCSFKPLLIFREYGLFFFLGVLAFKLGNKYAFGEYWFYIILAAGITFSVVFWKQGQYLIETAYVRLITGSAFSIFLFFIFGKANCIGNSRILAYLGKHSLEIFLIHQPVVTAMRIAITKIGISNALLGCVLNFCISVIIPIAVAVAAKKAGIWELLFRPYSFFIKKKQ